MKQASAYSNHAFVALGSNLPSGAGDPVENIDFALKALADISVASLKVSSVYSTSPVDSPPGTPDFLNAMAALVPLENETPHSLLNKLQHIENSAGRKRSGIRNEARTLDLDLILFGEVFVDTPTLVVPHSRAHERKFVLEPLIDIVGEDFCFPGRNETLGELLEGIGEEQVIRRK